MSTATLPGGKTTFFTRPLGGPQRAYFGDSKKQPGTKAYIIEQKPVFRSGAFADSEGIQSTWETTHINSMVDHYTLLSQRGVFEDVPVRKGHPDHGGLFGGSARNSMDELVGYITGMNSAEMLNPTDNKTYTYLLADYEILDPDAQQKIASGLWRNVSAEIGPFFTNDNAEYWPVLVGFAYVDIPAVQGLKQHARQGGFRVIMEESMSGAAVQPSGTVQGTVTIPSIPSGTPGAAPTFTAPQPQTTPPAAPAAPPTPAGTPEPKPGDGLAFQINGKTVTDPAAIQQALAERELLMTHYQDTRIATRVNFSKTLVDGQRVPPYLADELTNAFSMMDDNVFSVVASVLAKLPQMSITQQHGITTDNGPEKYQMAGTALGAPVAPMQSFTASALPGAPLPTQQYATPGAPAEGAQTQPDGRAQRIEVLKGQLRMHALTKTPKELERFNSFQELTRLVPGFTVSDL